jgi:hypothetical protein
MGNIMASANVHGGDHDILRPGAEGGVSEREKATEVWRRLEAAGWKAWWPGDGEGPTVWQNPRDGHWHTQEQAMAILEEDEGGAA